MPVTRDSASRVHDRRAREVEATGRQGRQAKPGDEQQPVPEPDARRIPPARIDAESRARASSPPLTSKGTPLGFVDGGDPGSMAFPR